MDFSHRFIGLVSLQFAIFL